MKKEKPSEHKPRKLKLSSETLRALEEPELREVAGGTVSHLRPCRPTLVVGSCGPC